MENKQCSDEFLKVFDSHMGTFSLTCSCGKTHFDNYNTGSDEDDLEELLEYKYKSFLSDTLNGKQYYLLSIPLNFKYSNIDFKQLLS